MNYQNKAYGDALNAYVVKMSIGSFYPINFFNGSYDKLTKIDTSSYIFLGRENTVNGNISLDDNENPRLNCKRVPLQNLTLNQALRKMNKLYNNGDAAVVYSSPNSF